MDYLNRTTLERICDFFYYNPRHSIRYRWNGWRAERDIRPGDIYEDCSYHPVVCTENDRGDLSGVSLIDGTWPRGCSYFHCGPRKLTIKEARDIKQNWKPGQDKVDWDKLSQA